MPIENKKTHQNWRKEKKNEKKWREEQSETRILIFSWRARAVSTIEIYASGVGGSDCHAFATQTTGGYSTHKKTAVEVGWRWGSWCHRDLYV